MRAWYMDGSAGDQREPHMTNPPLFVDLDTLKSLGVDYWKINAETYQQDSQLSEIRKSRSYDYEDQVICSPDKLPNYDEMIKKFFEEHIHSDDETRFVLDGSGYFDIREPKTDKWIRIEVVKDDMISLPAGLYHRFTLDTKNYIKANRYFSGTPCWTPLNRPQDSHPARVNYLTKLSA